MPSSLTSNVQLKCTPAKAVECLTGMSLDQWQQHYQAEAVDLRYFFHSGWSS